MAAEAGARVVLDAGGQEGPLSRALLSNVSILSPNETELARMTGLPTDTEAQIVQAAQALQEFGVSTVLVKLGADGALLVDADSAVTRVPAFLVKQVVDTTGAGDCFTASFCVGLLEGKSYEDAMRFAGGLLFLHMCWGCCSAFHNPQNAHHSGGSSSVCAEQGSHPQPTNTRASVAHVVTTFYIFALLAHRLHYSTLVCQSTNKSSR